jgi:hypothetical protein
MTISSISGVASSYRPTQVSKANDGDADDRVGGASSASAPVANDHDADDGVSASTAVQRVSSSTAAALTALQQVE